VPFFVGADCRPASKTDQRLAAIKAGTLRRPLMATLGGLIRRCL
jgi:hypothetical protein